MARNLFVDARMQNFWKEAVDKEAKARLAAYDRLRGRAKSQSRLLEVFRKKIEEGKPSNAMLERLPPIRVECGHNKVKVDYNHMFDPKSSEELSALRDVKDMRPPSPMLRKTLYDGFTKEGKGRNIYLKQRYDHIPEEKYLFPTCTSWDYGWKISEAGDQKGLGQGRQSIMERSFYSRNDVESTYYRAH